MGSESSAMRVPIAGFSYPGHTTNMVCTDQSPSDASAILGECDC